MKKVMMISLVAMAITSLATMDVLARGRGGGGGGGGRGGSSRGGMQGGGGMGSCGGSMQQMQQMQRKMMQYRHRYGQGNCQNGGTGTQTQLPVQPNNNWTVNPLLQAQYQQWLLQNQAALQARQTQQAQRANRAARRNSMRQGSRTSRTQQANTAPGRAQRRGRSR